MLKIVKDGKKVLRTRAKMVEVPLSEEDHKLALDMFAHIKESQDPEFSAKHKLRAGVGLAAPQVGKSKAILVVHIPLEDEKFLTYVLANPVIVSSSVRRAYLESGEGCLSVDKDYPGHVYRAYKIKVRAFDILNNQEIEISHFGYPAIVLQHEIDHLKGILFYDHIDANNKIKFPDAISL